MDEPHTPSQDTTVAAKLEALLFYYGEPIGIKKIADVLEISKEVCEAALLEFETTLTNTASRGVALLRIGDEVQLVTKPEWKIIGERVLKEEIRETLTPAALETLALVSYLGPIPRSTVDYIRGVNSSFTLRNLVLRGLIERTQNGNAYFYKPSFMFLKHMGLDTIGSLPEFEHFHDILKRFESQAAEAQSMESPRNPEPPVA